MAHTDFILHKLTVPGELHPREAPGSELWFCSAPPTFLQLSLGISVDHIQPSMPQLHVTSTPTSLRPRAAKAELELGGHSELREGARTAMRQPAHGDSSSLISGTDSDGHVEE